MLDSTQPWVMLLLRRWSSCSQLYTALIVFRRIRIVCIENFIYLWCAAPCLEAPCDNFSLLNTKPKHHLVCSAGCNVWCLCKNFMSFPICGYASYSVSCLNTRNIVCVSDILTCATNQQTAQHQGNNVHYRCHGLRNGCVVV